MIRAAQAHPEELPEEESGEGSFNIETSLDPSRPSASGGIRRGVSTSKRASIRRGELPDGNRRNFLRK
jgi:hypothetical protein